jgi:ABC-2 type transport system permease protein
MTPAASSFAAARPAGWKEPFHPEHSLWHYVWKLLRLQIAITISTFRAARLRRKIGTIIVYLLILIFAGFVFAMSWLLLALLRSPELAEILAQQNLTSVSTFLESVPVLILAGSFLGILVTSFGVLLQALYLAGDMDFLLAAPVPIRAVFVTKQLQAILPNFGLIALFALPVLFGLGAAGGYFFLYYPLVVIVLVMLALAAAGVSSLLVMGVVRIFPARRVAEVLGAVGAALSIICSQSGNFVNTMHLDEQNFNSRQIPLGAITRFNAAWNPLSWAGRGLVELGESRALTAILFLGLTIGLTGGLFLLSLQVAERLYYTGWASMQTGGRKKRTARVKSAAPPAKSGAASTLLSRFIPQPVLGVLGKDFLTLRRDLRNMSQLISPLIVGFVYMLFLFRPGGISSAGPDEAPEWLMQTLRTAMNYGSVGISLFVGWSLISRLGMMGFSQEGKNYWMLKTAPVRSAYLLAAKFLVAYLPGLVMGVLVLIVVSLVQGIPLSIMLFGLAVVSLSISGSAGINVAFGVTGVNLTWEDPRRMNSGWSGCLGMLLSFLYMGISLAFFFGPPVLLSALGLPEIIGQAIGVVVGGAFSLTCAVLPLRLVAPRVARIGDS